MFFTPVIRRSSLSPSFSSAVSPAFRSVDRNFERWLADSFAAPSPVATKGLSLEQDEKTYTLSFDLPGIAREQLSVSIEGNVVRLETKPDAARAFKAAYELAQELDAGTSTAKLELGVLTLTLGKKPSASHAAQVVVN